MALNVLRGTEKMHQPLSLPHFGFAARAISAGKACGLEIELAQQFGHDVDMAGCGVTLADLIGVHDPVPQRSDRVETPEAHLCCMIG